MKTLLTHLTLAETIRGLKDKSFSSINLTEQYLKRIDALDVDHDGKPGIHAYLHVARERALADAKQADERRARGEDAPLLGVPIALKDVFSTAGIPTTAGSKILEGYCPPTNATTTQKLVDAGMVLLGKLNTDEFTMGSSTENSAYGPSRNPWDLDRVPGGSSGGSAACVAGNLAAATLGTDTGGSIRQPAALTNTVGLRPTYGRISRSGVFSMASSLDTIGPITKDVTDAAILLQVLAGHDPADGTTPDLPVPDYLASLVGSLPPGLRIGVPKEVRLPGLHAGVESAFDAALKVLEGLGATIVDITLPRSELGLAVYYLVNTAEVSANMSRYDGIRFGPSVESEDLQHLYVQNRSRGFGPEVKRRIMLGTFVLSHGYKDAYYGKAQQVRSLILEDHENAFKQVDLIATPASPVPAFKIGEKTSDPLAMYLSDIYTVPSSLIGIPGISVPCGFADDLPVGLQLLAPQFAEPLLLRAAHAYEGATTWRSRQPVL